MEKEKEKTNVVAIIIQILAMLIGTFGTIAGVFMGALGAITGEFMRYSAIVTIIISILVGLFIYTLGNGLELLQRIANNTEK